MRYTIGVMLVLGLSGCVQETYYQGGVGFGTYEEYLAAREQREAALAGLLAPYGYDAAQVVAAGMIWQVILWVTGGLGGLLYIATGSSQIRTAPSQNSNAR